MPFRPNDGVARYASTETGRPLIRRQGRMNYVRWMKYLWYAQNRRLWRGAISCWVFDLLLAASLSARRIKEYNGIATPPRLRQQAAHAQESYPSRCARYTGTINLPDAAQANAKEPAWRLNGWPIVSIKSFVAKCPKPRCIDYRRTSCARAAACIAHAHTQTSNQRAPAIPKATAISREWKHYFWRLEVRANDAMRIYASKKSVSQEKPYW